MLVAYWCAQNLDSLKCAWPSGSIRPIRVLNVAQSHCDGVGLGIKIKDSAGFNWRWIVSMVVANASTPGRTWLLGPIKHTLSANAKMRIDE